MHETHTSHGGTTMVDLMVLDSCAHNNQSNKKLDFSCKKAWDDHDETKTATPFSDPKRLSHAKIAVPRYPLTQYWWVVVLVWLRRAYSGRNVFQWQMSIEFQRRKLSVFA